VNMGGADRGDKLKVNGNCSRIFDDDMAFHLVPAPVGGSNDTNDTTVTNGFLMRSKKYARTVMPRPGDGKLILGGKAVLMEDAPGLYYVTKSVEVTLGSSWDSKLLAKLPAGEFVQVDDFVHESSNVGSKWFGMRSDYHEIIRAHIVEPAGWINIMDTEEGVRWAHAVQDMTPDSKGSLLNAITIPERSMCEGFLKGEEIENVTTVEKNASFALSELHSGSSVIAESSFVDPLTMYAIGSLAGSAVAMYVAAGRDMYHYYRKNHLVGDEVFYHFNFLPADTQGSYYIETEHSKQCVYVDSVDDGKLLLSKDNCTTLAKAHPYPELAFDFVFAANSL